MALSGTITGGIDHYRLLIEWSATQNVAENASYVTARMYLHNDYNIVVGSRAGTTGKVGSSTATGTAPAVSGTGKRLLLTTSAIKVPHASDGTASVTISSNYPVKATLTINGVSKYYASFTASGSVSLNKLNRTPGTPGTPVGGGLGRGGYIYHDEAPGLTWSGASGTVTGYEVQMRYLARSGGRWSGWSTIGSPSETSLSSYRWAKSDAVAGGKVEFRVRAENESLAGEWSESLSLKIDGGGWVKTADGWKYGSIWVKTASGWNRSDRTWVKASGGWTRGK